MKVVQAIIALILHIMLLPIGLIMIFVGFVLSYAIAAFNVGSETFEKIMTSEGY